MPRLFAVLLLLLLSGAAHAQQKKTEPLAIRVKNSIARGVAQLTGTQQADGSWEVPNVLYKGGTTALSVLALLNCDSVLEDDGLEQRRKQSVEHGLKYLRTLDTPYVYSRSLQTMALAEAHKPGDLPLIVKNVEWLLKARTYRNGQFIGWGYGLPGVTTPNDASNSQYAMLALWYARQAGVKIDRAVWKEIRDYYVRSQNEDGSWVYSTMWGEEKRAKSLTMTVAGLCGLYIAGMELNESREQWQPNGTFANCGVYGENPAVARGLKWLVEHFALDRGVDTYYHLYGLERAGRLSGLRFFGDHDWYREGCEHITATQNPLDGSWPVGAWQNWPTANTSLALLFLSKGRTPVLISKLVHGKWQPPQGRNEQDSDWNNDRNDLRHLTEYVSGTDLFDHKPIAWQTYDISQALEARKGKDNTTTTDDEDAVVADMLQAPILYITGHKAPDLRIQGAERTLIKRFVDNGGFIFAEACCGSKDFDEGIKAWVKEMWQDQELTYIEPSHPVWTCWTPVKPGDPYKLMALSIGCRTVMLYSPQDLSCHWESKRKESRAFELGGNIIAYATGKVRPQPRLTPIPILSEKATNPPFKRGYFQVFQINHNSEDWQPAPKAMRNLLLHVNKVDRLDIMLQSTKINLRDSSEDGIVRQSKFFYMHGRKQIDSHKDEQLEPLRFTLRYGGLFFADACCGSETFDKSFRQFVQKLFPAEKLQRVPFGPERDVLFSKELNSGVALTAANIRCRTARNSQPASMEPYLEGIRINGRWVVLYSKYDIGCALERSTATDCVGYDPASALRIATAVVRYNTRP